MIDPQSPDTTVVREINFDEDSIATSPVVVGHRKAQPKNARPPKENSENNNVTKKSKSRPPKGGQVEKMSEAEELLKRLKEL